MRNLAAYPVTKDEIINTLSELSKSISDEGALGDMRPLILRHAVDLIKDIDQDTISEKTKIEVRSA